MHLYKHPRPDYGYEEDAICTICSLLGAVGLRFAGIFSVPRHRNGKIPRDGVSFESGRPYGT